MTSRLNLSLETPPQQELSAVLAAPAMLQQARRVAEISLAQSLSTPPPGTFPVLIVSEIEDNGRERHGPRGAATAVANVFASRVQTSSSSSVAQVQNPWEGIPDYFKDQLIRVVSEIEILSNNVEQAFGESPRLEKLKLTKRMKDYYGNVMKYIDRDVVLDSVIKYMICFNEITLKQKEIKKDKNTGRSPQFFYEVFKGWIAQIQAKLSRAQLAKFNQMAVDPYSEVRVQREALKDSLLAVMSNFDGLLDRARSIKEGAAGKERKILSARKSRFVDRVNDLVEGIDTSKNDLEIMELATQIGMKIQEFSEWQSTTQKKSKSGATMGILGLSAVCPKLSKLIGFNDSIEQPKDFSSVSKRDPILKRIDSVVTELNDFITSNSSLFKMDKKSLAKPANLEEALKLRNSCKSNKVDFVSKRLGDYFHSPKDGDLAEIAQSVDQLAFAFNALGEFQSKCPKAKQIKYFYDIYPTFAEKLRPFLPANSAVFTPSPGVNKKQMMGQKSKPAAPKRDVRSKKQVVESSESESSSESSRSSSSSSESSSESSDSSSESGVDIAPRTRGANLKRPSSTVLEQDDSKRRRLEPRLTLTDDTSMELVMEPPIESDLPLVPEIATPVSVEPSIQALSLEERYNHLLARLKEKNKVIPGFPRILPKAEEELALDNLDLHDLYFKKTQNEKMAIVSAHIEKLKNLLGVVWRSDEAMSQKRVFVCQIAQALHEVIFRASQVEFDQIKDLVAGFAETLNPLLREDAELRSFLGNKSFSLLYPAFTNYCMKKGDETLLSRIFSPRERELLSL